MNLADTIKKAHAAGFITAPPPTPPKPKLKASKAYEYRIYEGDVAYSTTISSRGEAELMLARATRIYKVRTFRMLRRPRGGWHPTAGFIQWKDAEEVLPR